MVPSDQHLSMIRQALNPQEPSDALSATSQSLRYTHSFHIHEIDTAALVN